ncbi:hypothetical protein NPIL_52171 [Nephila pilipes]|uniref:Uncharacterized protein n=1 Tax=Nephila pilipes TaxID=299642 RepID=A0A8X6TLU4_NEPPI|nr:hypothetical protein NPIL_52171 [Nephila pilipes]
MANFSRAGTASSPWQPAKREKVRNSQGGAQGEKEREKCIATSFRTYQGNESITDVPAVVASHQHSTRLCHKAQQIPTAFSPTEECRKLPDRHGLLAKTAFTHAQHCRSPPSNTLNKLSRRWSHSSADRLHVTKRRKGRVDTHASVPSSNAPREQACCIKEHPERHTRDHLYHTSRIH